MGGGKNKKYREAEPILPDFPNFGAAVVNNMIYLVGGQDGANVLGSTDQYSPPVTLYTFTKN